MYSFGQVSSLLSRPTMRQYILLLLIASSIPALVLLAVVRLD